MWKKTKKNLYKYKFIFLFVSIYTNTIYLIYQNIYYIYFLITYTDYCVYKSVYKILISTIYFLFFDRKQVETETSLFFLCTTWNHLAHPLGWAHTTLETTAIGHQSCCCIILFLFHLSGESTSNLCCSILCRPWALALTFVDCPLIWSHLSSIF